jgi:hypothetical protein
MAWRFDGRDRSATTKTHGRPSTSKRSFDEKRRPTTVAHLASQVRAAHDAKEHRFALRSTLVDLAVESIVCVGE